MLLNDNFYLQQGGNIVGKGEIGGYQYFSYITAASVPIHTFLQFFNPVLRTILLPSHLLISHITIVEAMDSSERGMNPVAMAINSPRKEYWQSQGSKQPVKS